MMLFALFGFAAAVGLAYVYLLVKGIRARRAAQEASEPMPPGSIDPGAADEALLAQQHFAANRFDEFEAAASKALAGGAAIFFPLQHYHAAGDVHSVQISVSKYRVDLEPVVAGPAALPPVQTFVSKCDLPRFSTNIQNLISCEVVRKDEGPVLLKLKLRSASRSGSIHALNFADQYSAERAWVVRSALKGRPVRRTITARPEAERSLAAIRHAVEQAAALGHLTA